MSTPLASIGSGSAEESNLGTHLDGCSKLRAAGSGGGWFSADRTNPTPKPLVVGQTARFPADTFASPSDGAGGVAREVDGGSPSPKVSAVKLTMLRFPSA